MKRLPGYCALCLLATAAPLSAQQQYESPAERVTVVELFTSHGCSSCPPADDWMHRLGQAPGLWNQVIPLAFHVDYWDYLGWQDRFATAEHSQRQRDYRRSGALGSVYTPGVLVNGREWRGWYWGKPLPERPHEQVGRLRLEVPPQGPLSLRFTPGRDWSGVDVIAHLAILGSDLESFIGGGENRGHTLRESFVVLSHAVSGASESPHAWQLDWPAFEPVDPGRYAVVAWLSSAEDPTPLQAVGGWLAHPGF